LNQATANSTTVGGGTLNSANAEFSTVGGGYANNAGLGAFATIPGGSGNIANGRYSFAAGRNASASHDGSFVWADSTSSYFSSWTPNVFMVRASGGTAFYSDAALTSGVTLVSGGGSWTLVSDSTLKRNIREVDYLDITEKVASMPISRFSP